MRSTFWFVLHLLGIVAIAQGENSDSGVKFYLYTRHNTNGEQMQWDASSILSSGFNPNDPTKIVIPGWINTLTSPMPTELRNALLQAEPCNVIVVDWTEYSHELYPVSRMHVKKVGEVVAKFLEFLIQQGLLARKDVHIIGHSLGAHVSGNAGKAFQKLTNDKLPWITGLDPAGPLFLRISDDKLQKDDAEIVDVVHTSAGTQGIDYNVGTLDFWVNGGKKQPGCGLDPIGSCSHDRAFWYFKESIVNRNAFGNAALRNSDQTYTSNRGSARMGYWLQFSEPGSYDIDTAPEVPYSLAP